MIQVIFNFNYYIKSIDYNWTKNIIISDTRDIFDIVLEDAKDYLHLYNPYPFSTNNLWEHLRFIKGINSKAQVKAMIKSKDLTCIGEVIFFDIMRLLNATQYIYDKNYKSFNEFEQDILVYKEYKLDYQLNRYSLYYGDDEPSLSYNYIGAQYRINFINKAVYDIGNTVDFIYNDSIETGVIIYRTRLLDFIELYKYDIALIDKEDNKYTVIEFIAGDDIIKVYDGLDNYIVVKECVLNDNISSIMKYDEKYKLEIREFLIENFKR